MKKHLVLFAFLLAPASTASAVNLSLDYSIIQAEAAFGPAFNSNSRTLSLPGAMSVTGYQPLGNSLARARVDYVGANDPTVATFNFDIDLEGTHTATLHHSTARVFVSLSLQLHEPMAYSIGGALNCITDLSGVQFYGNWVLFDSYSASYYYQKAKWAFDSAMLEADDLPDPSVPTFPTATTGILPASTYFFLFIAELDTTNAPGATANITGYTNLTLSRIVPEPSGLTLLNAILGTALFRRSSRRLSA